MPWRDSSWNLVSLWNSHSGVKSWNGICRWMVLNWSVAPGTPGTRRVHPWPRKKSSPADSGPGWGVGEKKEARVSFWAVSLHHTGVQIYRRISRCVPFPVFKTGNDVDRNDKCLVLPREKALGKRYVRLHEPRYVPKRLLVEFHCNISGWWLCSLCCVYPQEAFPFLQSYSSLRSGSKFLMPCFASQQLKHGRTCQLCRRRHLLCNQTFDQRPLCLQYQRLSSLYHLPTIYK